MINLKLKPDLVQSLDRLNFYSFSLLSNENLNNDEKLSLFSKANTFITSLLNNSKINFTKTNQHFTLSQDFIVTRICHLNIQTFLVI